MSTEPETTETQSPYELRDARITLENEVVLAPETRRMFDEAIGAMRHHKTIYTDWGFGAVDPMGRNMILNLYGPPGTGKTTIVRAIATELRDWPVLSVSTSAVMDKYVGESEKKIRIIF